MRQKSIDLQLLALSVLLGAAISCGGSGSETLGVTNVSPKGSVGGLVYNAATRKPLAGAQVLVIAGGATYPAAGAVKTDDKGRFAIADVPSGGLIVNIIGPAGYAPVNIASTLANSAGEFPLANATLSIGPVGLVPLSTDATAFKIRVVFPDGSPAHSVKAQIRAAPEWINFRTGNGVAVGHVVAAATSSAIGILSFKDIPDYSKLAGLVGIGGITDSVRIHVLPHKGADGNYDFLGREFTFSVNRLSGSIPTVVLTSANRQLKIVGTTVPAINGQSGNRAIVKSGSLFVAFNWPVVQASSTITLTDELGQAVAKPTVAVDGAVMTLTFTNLAEGANYNLNMHVIATAEGQLVSGSFGGPFFTHPGAGKKVTATLIRDQNNTQRINVLFSEPIGIGKAGQNMSAGNAVLYFAADIDNSGTTGDAAGELGSTSSPYGLTINEIDPPGKAGRSGLSTRWYFTVPNSGKNPLPSGTTVHFKFSQSAAPIIRGTNILAGDFSKSLPN